ncbi:hypothetical protein BC629DRAFT_1725701 [Irpex lacteus]|nr:hypothetical protein BC629DRAFT_1725701 [Irpex lacteus]
MEACGGLRSDLADESSPSKRYFLMARGGPNWVPWVLSRPKLAPPIQHLTGARAGACIAQAREDYLNRSKFRGGPPSAGSPCHDPIFPVNLLSIELAGLRRVRAFPPEPPFFLSLSSSSYWEISSPSAIKRVAPISRKRRIESGSVSSGTGLEL